MDEYVYQLQLAGAIWRVSSPVELEVPESCAPFLTGEGTPDCTLDYTIGHPEITGTVMHEQNPRVWETEDSFLIERIFSAAIKPAGCVQIRKADPLHMRGWIYPEQADRVRDLMHLLDLSDLEIALASLGAVSLHSSLIRYRGEGILFTAPSGTGKSTQAELWEQYENADTINGDRSLLRMADGHWTAFGGPFAGSSGIYRNESVPIRALVVLEQAPENTIELLKPAEAFRKLYSEMVLPRWNNSAHTRVISIVTRLCTELPVWILRCTPDQRAVDLLKETIWRDTP